MTYLVDHLHRTESAGATSPLIVHRFAILTVFTRQLDIQCLYTFMAADSALAIPFPASPTASARGSRRASACSSPPAAPSGEHQRVWRCPVFIVCKIYFSELEESKLFAVTPNLFWQHKLGINTSSSPPQDSLYRTTDATPWPRPDFVLTFDAYEPELEATLSQLGCNKVSPHQSYPF